MPADHYADDGQVVGEGVGRIITGGEHASNGSSKRRTESSFSK